METRCGVESRTRILRVLGEASNHWDDRAIDDTSSKRVGTCELSDSGSCRGHVASARLGVRSL